MCRILFLVYSLLRNFYFSDTQAKWVEKSKTSEAKQQKGEIYLHRHITLFTFY